MFRLPIKMIQMTVGLLSVLDSRCGQMTVIFTTIIKESETANLNSLFLQMDVFI